MLIVVAYDISDEKRLNRVAKTLKNFGHRVQRSVFECYLDHYQLMILKKKLLSLVNTQEDSIRFYYICKEDTDRLKHIGNAKIFRDEDYFFV